MEESTVEKIYDGMSDEQKKLCEFLVGNVYKEAQARIKKCQNEILAKDEEIAELKAEVAALKKSSTQKPSISSDDKVSGSRVFSYENMNGFLK